MSICIFVSTSIYRTFRSVWLVDGAGRARRARKPGQMQMRGGQLANRATNAKTG